MLAVHQRLADLGHDFFRRDQETPEMVADHQGGGHQGE